MRGPATFSGRRLQEIRLRRGLTQSQLARRAEVGEKQIVRWENDQHVPRADAVGVLASALEVDVGDFYERADDGEEDEESDLVRLAAELEARGQLDMADELRARAKRIAAGRRRVRARAGA